MRLRICSTHARRIIICCRSPLGVCLGAAHSLSRDGTGCSQRVRAPMYACNPALTRRSPGRCACCHSQVHPALRRVPVPRPARVQVLAPCPPWLYRVPLPLFASRVSARVLDAAACLPPARAPQAGAVARGEEDRHPQRLLPVRQRAIFMQVLVRPADGRAEPSLPKPSKHSLQSDDIAGAFKPTKRCGDSLAARRVGARLARAY